MLTSLAIIILFGLLLGYLFNALKIPSLVGMIFLGIIIGPNVLDLVDTELLAISSNLRQVALVIILTRAGLSLNFADLKKIGLSAALMCFVPACFEMLGVALLAPLLFKISLSEALLLGSVLAAVSPAVIVPRMISIIEKGYGNKNKVCQLLLAGASVDDVFVIVCFYAFLNLVSNNQLDLVSFINIPLSIFLGIILGIMVSYLLAYLYKSFSFKPVVEVAILLCVSFLLLELENQLKEIVPLSALLAIMSMGMGINFLYPNFARTLANNYNKLWVIAEVILFVLVGVLVDLDYVFNAGAYAIILVVFALLIRMIGVYLSVIPTNFAKKEKIFCMISYLPKATVQAAIGSIALQKGLACGNLIMTVSVVAIVLTASVGAFLIDLSYDKLLSQ